MWLLVKTVVLALDNSSQLSAALWMNKKRYFYCKEITKTPTMKKMLDRVKTTKKITSLLLLLVRQYKARCTDNRYVSFLRAVGVARPMEFEDWIILSSPIVRDALLQEFYPACNDIEEIIFIPDSLPTNYALSVILKAIPYMKAAELLDPLVMYAKGLSEASIHAELYRILHSLFQNQPITILTETKVVKSTDMRCDLWMNFSLSEIGIEVKSELSTKEMEVAASGQLLKYASSRSPREMLLINFVRKEVESVVFPINIKPRSWESYSDTAFSVLFVLVLGDNKSGLKFRYALNSYYDWVDL
jgi:hypothetical protein